MNSKERFLTAMAGGQPDRVPCTPDFSNMIPCRLTGKPFWDIYLHENPPLWQAYLQAADYFGIDAWFYYGALDFKQPNASEVYETTTTIAQNADQIVQRLTLHTPDGNMTGEVVYGIGDPPTMPVKYVKDLRADFAKLRHQFTPPSGYTTTTARLQKAQVGDRHAFGTAVGFPGFQWWACFTQGGVEPLAYAEADYPEVLEEICALCERMALKRLEMALDSKLFDFVLVGGSGAITLASPALFDKYAFPCIQKMTRMCKQAGVLTILHSCGKETHIVKHCAEESDLNCINPLEIPPMGDCDLAELKRLYGGKIALMGNLHTTDIMLRGTPADVERAARKCIDDAAAGGGFILSTGDQCPRDTPDANLFKLVEVCQTYGKYD